jgi:hypothetical protein
MCDEVESTLTWAQVVLAVLKVSATSDEPLSGQSVCMCVQGRGLAMEIGSSYKSIFQIYIFT